MSRSLFAGRRTTGILALAACGASLACAAPAAAGAATAKPRLSSLGATVTLADTLPHLASGSHWFGAASLTGSARALVSIQHRDQPELLKDLAAVSDPTSPDYQHYLTAKQFDARFAPTGATVSSVESYLTSFGLKVTSVPVNRAYVMVVGNVGEMNRAFNTTIDSYMRLGGNYEAPRTQLSIPAALRGVITGVTGLDTGNIATPDTASETKVLAAATAAAKANVTAHANTASCITDAPPTPTTTTAADLTKTPPTAAYVNAPPFSTSFDSCAATQAPVYPATGGSTLGDVIEGYTPAQLEGGYGISGAIAAGLNGAGETVAVIDAYSSPTMQVDAAQWSKNMGLPAPNLTLNDNLLEESEPEGPSLPTDVPIVGGVNLQDPAGWFGEESLDVEAVHAMAPGAKIIVQSATDALGMDLEVAQNDVVTADVAQEVSNSYGGAGGGEDTTDSTSDGYWQQAAMEGMGVEFAAGDDGDNTSCGATPADAGLDGDSNSPYVTDVGGTTLAVGPSDKYMWETYWGDETATLTNGAWGTLSCDGGGGGGVSQAYGEPSYQTGVVPSSIANYWKGNPNAGSAASGGTDPVIPGRAAPDVAMLADPNSGFLMGQTQDFDTEADEGISLPTDGQAYDQYRIGGTSLASPLFAGMMALADQANGKGLGFHNPALYALYTKNPSAYHDPDTTSPVAGIVRTNYNDTTGEAGTVASNITTVLRTFNVLGVLQALPGYDDSTGLGSPNGLAFLCGLAPNSTTLKTLVGSPCNATATTTTTAPAKTTVVSTKPSATGKPKVCVAPKSLGYAQHPAAPAREVRAVVYVNGKKIRTLKAKRIIKINVARPKAAKVTVKIVSTLSDGEVVSHTYKYNGCKTTYNRFTELHKPTHRVSVKR